jgi:hypothetical protein
MSETNAPSVSAPRVIALALAGFEYAPGALAPSARAIRRRLAQHLTALVPNSTERETIYAEAHRVLRGGAT